MTENYPLKLGLGSRKTGFQRKKQLRDPGGVPQHLFDAVYAPYKDVKDSAYPAAKKAAKYIDPREM